MNNSKLYTVLLLTFLVGLFLFHLPAINEFPSYIHAWAQSDYYALALGYCNNGHNLFLPEGMIYNHQFPGDWRLPNTTTITSADFPIIPWIASLFMRLFGTTEPWVFRLITLLYSLVGIYFFGKGLQNLKFGISTSFILLGFLCFSPTFLYYQNGFMPTIAALSSVFISFYFLTKWQNEKVLKQLVWAVIFLILAALIRKTYFILFFGSFLIFMYLQWKYKSGLKKLYKTYFIGFLLFFTYWFYNSYLERSYGSIFLGSIIPAGDFAEFVLILKESFQNWAYSFYGKTQITVGIALFLIGLTLFLRKKEKLLLHKMELLFIAIIYLGSMLFVVLMAKQFVVHNYYLLDTFFIPNLLFLTWCIQFLTNTKTNNIILNIAIIPILALFSYTAIDYYQQARTTSDFDRSLTGNRFKNADDLLRRVGAKSEDKILVLDNAVQHAPFIRMKHKGYTIPRVDSQRIQEALSWDFQFIAYENQFFQQVIYKNYPEIINYIQVVASNDDITIAKKRLKPKNIGLSEYLSSFGTYTEHIYKDNEKSPEVEWLNLYPGEEGYHVRSSMEFGPGFYNKNVHQKIRNVQFRGKVKWINSEPFVFVFDMEQNGKTTLYQGFSSREMKLVKNEWSDFELNFEVPKDQQNNLFRCYFYNPEKSDFICKDLQLIIITEK